MFSKQDFYEKLQNTFIDEKDNIEILEYTNLNTKGKFKCLKCSNIFEVQPLSLIKRRSKVYCMNCNSAVATRDKDKKALEKAISLFNKTPNLHLIETYQKQQGDRRRLAVKYYCDICGHTSEMYYTNLKNDYFSCRWCSKGTALTLDKFEWWLDYYYNGNFELVDDKDFLEKKNRLHIRCNKCNFIFTPTLTTLRRTKKALCPKCRSGKSRGEIYIGEWLSKNNYDYLSEVNFDWLDNKHLRYDYVIPSLKLIIEYDGEQHYKYTPYFGSYEKFEKMKANDILKNSKAIENGYFIIRIPFTYENKIDLILSKLFGSTTIPYGSRGKLLEIDSILKDEDIV